MASKITSSTLSSSPSTYFFSLAAIKSDYATIGSDDCLRIFDASTLSVSQAYQKCNQGVECLVNNDDRSLLFTGGRDGMIRAWDQKSTSKTTEIKEPKATGISTLACRGNFVAAGTESMKEGLADVSVHIFDVRKPTTALRTYNESHTDTITDLAWHPTQQNILLSGSTDGLVSLFDVDQADEEDAIQQVLNPRSAVHCSGFLAEDQAYVLSTDEQFTIYGLNKTGTAEEAALPVAEFGDVRSKLDAMYVIKLIQNEHTTCLAHGHNNDRRLALTVLNRPDYNFASTVNLPGAHGEEVVRDIVFVNANTILSCGEDGHVCSWRLDDQASQMDLDEPKISRKKAKKDKKTVERFAPY